MAEKKTSGPVGMEVQKMKKRFLSVVVILAMALTLTCLSTNNVAAYYGGTTGSYGLYGGTSLYGGYGGGTYGGLGGYGGLYGGSSLYGGLGGYGGMYGSSMYGGMMGGMYGGMMGGMYGGMMGGMYGGMMGGMYGSSYSPFGLQNMYYTIDTGTGLSYQVPFMQIAPLLGVGGLYNSLFPSLFSPAPAAVAPAATVLPVQVIT